MRELLERMANDNLSEEDLARLEIAGLVIWYDGYQLTTLGWVLLLKDRAPVEQIKMLLDIEESGYQALLSQLKEISL